MQQIGGSCSKCGAPFYVESPWWGTVPPSPTPTCACWNLPKFTTTTQCIIPPPEENLPFSILMSFPSKEDAQEFVEYWLYASGGSDYDGFREKHKKSWLLWEWREMESKLMARKVSKEK